jgi:hypothetical protein
MIRFFSLGYTQIPTLVAIRFMLVSMASGGIINAFGETRRVRSSYDVVAKRSVEWFRPILLFEVLRRTLLERFYRLLSTSGSPPS